MDNLYCSKYLQKHDPETFYCLEQSEVSDLAISLFQLNLELSKISQNSGEKAISFLKLSWWQEVVSDFYHHNKQKKEHPSILLLSNVIAKYDIKQADLEALVNAREFDTQSKQFNNVKELEHYVDKYLYQIFAIIISCQKITLSKAEKQSIRNLCYILKTVRVINSLPKRNYNDHPFIPKEIITKVRTLPAIKRQEEIITILKTYLANLLAQTPKLETSSEFINKFQHMVKYQADKTLKYSSSSSIAYISIFKLRCYLWWKSIR